MDRVEAALGTLRQALGRGRLGHAYLVVGPVRETGIPFSQRVAQGLYCAHGMAAACGECRDCRRIAQGTHPDIVSVEPQKKKRIISVDQVREISRQANLSAYEGGWKVVIVAHADRMEDAAGNAFLKTLEEPPERTLFLLLSDTPDAVLKTLQSRCQRLTLSTESSVLPAEWAEPVYEVLAMPGSSQSLLAAAVRVKQLTRVMDRIRKAAEQEIKDEEKVSQVDESDETIEARIEARYKEYRLGVLRAAIGWYRDLLVLASGLSDAPLVNPQYRDTLQKRAASISSVKALACIDILQKVVTRLNQNIKEETVFSVAFLDLE